MERVLKPCPSCGNDDPIGIYRMLSDSHVACRKCGAEFPVMSLLPEEEVKALRRPGGAAVLYIGIWEDGEADHYGDAYNAYELRVIVDHLHTNLDPTTRAATENLAAQIMFGPTDDRCRLCGALAGGDRKHRCK